MFCTKCGSEMPDGTDFCTNCGARMGAVSPAAAPAEPAPMPAAGMPPVQGAVQKKSHKRAVIVGMCVAGVLVAGGAALALTGVLGPLGQGNSSQITVLGADEGSAEHKDKGNAKENRSFRCFPSRNLCAFASWRWVFFLFSKPLSHANHGEKNEEIG